MSERAFDVLVIGELNADLILTGDVTLIFGQIEKIVNDPALTIGSSAVTSPAARRVWGWLGCGAHAVLCLRVCCALDPGTRRHQRPSNTRAGDDGTRALSAGVSEFYALRMRIQ